MEWLVWLTTILLVLGVGGVAVMKLSNNGEVMKQATRLGYEPIRRSPDRLRTFWGVALR